MFLFISQIMDDSWESEVIEYGAINITGFRIVDTSRRYVKDFLDARRRMDPQVAQSPGRDSISVSFTNSCDKSDYSVHYFSQCN